MKRNQFLIDFSVKNLYINFDSRSSSSRFSWHCGELTRQIEILLTVLFSHQWTCWTNWFLNYCPTESEEKFIDFTLLPPSPIISCTKSVTNFHLKFELRLESRLILRFSCRVVSSPFQNTQNILAKKKSWELTKVKHSMIWWVRRGKAN